MKRNNLLLGILALLFIGFLFYFPATSKEKEHVETQISGSKDEVDDSEYRNKLVEIVDGFSIKLKNVADNSVKRQNEEITNEEFLSSIEELHQTAKDTQGEIELLLDPPESLKEGVELLLAGISKVENVTQTIIDYEEGKVSYEEVDAAQTEFFEALGDLEDAEQVLGIKIERGGI